MDAPVLVRLIGEEIAHLMKRAPNLARWYVKVYLAILAMDQLSKINNFGSSNTQYDNF